MKQMRKSRLMAEVAFALLLGGFVSTSAALPSLNQTGNLIQNGNFETGSYSSWLTNHSPTVSISTANIIDGDYSAFIDTTSGVPPHAVGEPSWMVGPWQYPGYVSGTVLPDGVYTISAWIYPIQGQAFVGMAWNSGLPSYKSFSPFTDNINQWQYLEVVAIDTTGLKGPILYGLSNNDKFYIDAVWVNSGSVNLSPYAPENEFSNPNTSVPEPSTFLLLGAGLAGVGIMRRMMRR